MLFRHLKVTVDANRRAYGRILLTGSRKFTLMTGVSESLADRADIMELETLSFAEIHRARARTGLETAIVRGGFPELHANPAINSSAFYNSSLVTYLLRDVRSLANVGSLRDFERLLRACALRSANLLNKADLARDVGIAPSTANQWLSVLEASGLFEAKWTELPASSDAVNLACARDIVGSSRVAGGGIICRARNGFPLDQTFRAVTVADLA